MKKSPYYIIVHMNSCQFASIFISNEVYDVFGEKNFDLAIDQTIINHKIDASDIKYIDLYKNGYDEAFKKYQYKNKYSKQDMIEIKDNAQQGLDDNFFYTLEEVKI